MLAFLLTAVSARAQQNAAPIELARLTNGAMVSFITSGGGLGIEIKGGDTPSLSQPKPAWIEVFHSEADIRQIECAHYKTVSKDADDVVARRSWSTVRSHFTSKIAGRPRARSCRSIAP